MVCPKCGNKMTPVFNTFEVCYHCDPLESPVVPIEVISSKKQVIGEQIINLDGVIFRYARNSHDDGRPFDIYHSQSDEGGDGWCFYKNDIPDIIDFIKTAKRGDAAKINDVKFIKDLYLQIEADLYQHFTDSQNNQWWVFNNKEQKRIVEFFEQFIEE